MARPVVDTGTNVDDSVTATQFWEIYCMYNVGFEVVLIWNGFPSTLAVSIIAQGQDLVSLGEHKRMTSTSFNSNGATIVWRKRYLDDCDYDVNGFSLDRMLSNLTVPVQTSPKDVRVGAGGVNSESVAGCGPPGLATYSISIFYHRPTYQAMLW